MEFLSIEPKTLWIIGILIFSVIIHEISHGYAAYFQGDSTAEQQGRLTLNPIPHIDPIGSILLPAFFVITGSNFFLGWAKPVPYNPNNLKNKKWGEAMVALAGPLSNIILAIIFLIVTFFLMSLNITNEMTMFLMQSAIFMNLFLAVLNLLPVAPLDGSKILYALLPYPTNFKVRNFMEKNHLIIFIFLIIFLLQTNFLTNIVFFLYKFLINLFF